MKIDSILILAAGFGSRLKPYTNLVPKSLLTLGDSNLLRNLIDQSAEYFAGSKIFVNASYLAEQIIDEIAKIPIRRRPHVIWEQDPLGPSLTVTNFCNAKLENTLVIHGDVFFADKTFFDFSNSIKSKRQDISVLLCHQKPTGIARSIVVERYGLVQSILEVDSNFGTQNELNSTTNHVLSNSGALVVRNRSLVDFVPERGSGMSPGLVNFIAKGSGLYVEKCTDVRISVDSENSYLAAKKYYNNSGKLFNRAIQH